jgi:L-fuculose-phosphate aldolase
MLRVMWPSIETAREQVAQVSRRLAAERLVHGSAGNVSVRTGDRVAITPTGSVLGELEPADVVIVDLDGRRLEGALAPSSELELNLGVYRRYGAGAVVHCHAPIATALSTVLDELPCVHYELMLLGGPVRVAPYATFGSPELAANVLAALEGRTGALMANHGIVTLGDDAWQALDRTLLLEWVCEIYWRAAAVGEPRTLSERELVAAAAAFDAQRSIVDMSG